jgi:hypothetical protein
MLLRPLQDQAAELRNRIAAGERTGAQFDRVTPGLLAFGANGPQGTGAPVGTDGKIEATVKPDQISAKLEGSATVSGNITVSASSSLIEIVNKAINIQATGHLSAGGSGSGGSDKGVSMPEASPGGKQGTAE